MIIETLSTFPGMYDSVMGASMMRRAQDKGILDFTAYDLRDWTYDRHRTTDDDPYGGGAGLVMRVEPLFEAVEAIAGAELGEGLAHGHAQSLRQSCSHGGATGASGSCGTRLVDAALPRCSHPYSQAERPWRAFLPMSLRSCLPSKLMRSQAS